MSVEPMVYCLLLGCLISLLIIPVVLLPGLVRTLVEPRDHDTIPQPPDARTNPPRLGGIPLALAFLAVSLLTCFLSPLVWAEQHRQILALIWTALAMALVGAWDDFRPLGLGKKILLQSIISLAAFLQGIHIETFSGTSAGVHESWTAWSGILTVLWLVGLTNLFNRIDVFHGLAGGIGLLLMGLLAYLGAGADSGFTTLCAIGMAGALLGFLTYNLPPARIALGGGGACLVGFLIANLVILQPGKDTKVAAFMALVLPLFGLCLVVLRNGSDGKLRPLTPASASSDSEAVRPRDRRERSLPRH